MKLNWIILSIVAMLTFSVMVTLISFVSRKGTPITITLLGIFLVAAFCYGIQVFFEPQLLKSISALVVVLIIGMGLLSFIGNWAQLQALNTAPNPGLAIAIISFQSGIIALLSVIFFKDKMTMLQITGLIITLIGVSCISLGSSK